MLTPESIKGKLFSLHNSAHSLHLDTRSFAEHEALKTAYTELVEFKDSLCEMLMGYQNGKRIGKIKLDEVPLYSQEAVNQLVKDGMSFSKELYEWAEDKGYCDVSNTAQALSGLFAQTLYRLTLS
jgi:hypothetical protein